jgi:NAD+ synthase
LRENQTDQDSLPPYEVLDDILSCLVEHEMSLPEIIARPHPTDTVKRIERLLYLAEYKRRQAAPGVKISSRSFGRDRRYPITNRFREDPAAPKPESTAPVERAPQLVQPRADGGDVS